jgi:hypothetical protein
MKYSFLLLPVFLLQTSSYAQRATRKLESSTITTTSKNFEGRFFTVTLSNTDIVPILLKLGPYKRIDNNDTLNLARTYPCNDRSVGEYYDLHDLVSEEDNCVRWYSLQLVKPNDSLQFVIKLKDFGNSDTSRLYFCYTKEIKVVDKEYGFYTDPKKFLMMKDMRDFSTNYVTLTKNTSNTGLAKVGLSVYLSTNH